MNRIDLDGRRAVVTGGAQGIGYAIAERLLRSGAGVALWDHDAAELATACAGLAPLGRAHPVRVDVTSLAAVEAAVAATHEALGGIDILVCNAGIAGPSVKLWEYPVAEWQRVIDIDLTGVFHCLRAVVPGMIAQNYGRICSTASIAGKEGNPNASAYSAAKAGVIALTKSLGKELAELRHRGQLHHPGRRPHPDLRADQPAAHRLHARQDPPRPLRAGRGDREHGGLAGLGRELVHHRCRVRPERRPRDLLSHRIGADAAQRRGGP